MPLSERALTKLRKRVAKAQRKQRYAEALELQQQVCDGSGNTEAEDFVLLAHLAEASKRPRLAVEARLLAARCTRMSAADWLALAEQALKAEMMVEATDALFRAGDIAATSGDLEEALAVFSRLLDIDPRHRPAQRIHNLLIARTAHAKSLVVVEGKSVVVTDTSEFVFGEPPRTDDDDDDDDVGDDSTDASSSQDGGQSPTSYVLNRQPWPSVLDDYPLVFSGAMTSLGSALADLDALAEPLRVADGDSVTTQGERSALLYTVERGAIEIRRSRPDAAVLGRVATGQFFAEVGTLMGLPNTASAVAKGASELRVVTRQRLLEHIGQSKAVPPLLSQLRQWYLDSALSLCPLFVHGDAIAWRGWLSGEPLTFQPGEPLSIQGCPDTLYVILTGFADVMLVADTIAVGATIRTFFPDRAPRARLGYLCPGDIVGELDPPPVTATACTPVTALRVARENLALLSDDATEALAQRTKACREAVEYGLALVHGSRR